MSTKDWIDKDFYKVLGVKKDASADEIRKAYRALARAHHPDKNPDNASAEAKFKEVSEAYDVLSDAKTRKEYDEARTLFGSGAPRFPGGFGGGRPGSQGGGSGGINLDDLLSQMRQEGRGAGGPAGTGGGGFGDVLGGLFNRGGRSTTQPARRGADVESEATISFAEALDGVTVSMRLTSDEPCSTCSGTGAAAGTSPRMCATCNGTGQAVRGQGGFALTEPCRACRGRGLVVDTPCATCSGSGRGRSARPVSARIPPGVSDGARIRLKIVFFECRCHRRQRRCASIDPILCDSADFSQTRFGLGKGALDLLLLFFQSRFVREGRLQRGDSCSQAAQVGIVGKLCFNLRNACARSRSGPLSLDTIQFDNTCLCVGETLLLQTQIAVNTAVDL